MNYNLNTRTNEKEPWYASVRKLLPLLQGEKKFVVFSLYALLVETVATLLGPYLIGYTIDTFVVQKSIEGIQYYSLLLLGVYVVAFVANFFQIRVIGAVSQRLLFKLRNLVFTKIQEVPLAFFGQNKAGDLISRINNDTQKLSQFFSETLTRFLGSIFIIAGAAVFLIIVHVKLGTATLLPALVLWLCTLAISGWVKTLNRKSLKASGLLSGEVQEGIQNFKVIVAFNRRDYFRRRFEEINESNYKANIKSDILNNIFTPLYDFAANMGQYAVLVYGIYLISQGQVTIGVLVSFLAYAEKFYNPLRQMAQLWASIQVSLAAWSRISVILSLESNLLTIGRTQEDTEKKDMVLEFENVSFGYNEGQEILKHAHIELQKGKVYALVGPTGGGKTTTASLMARLYDPQEGKVLLCGRDIREYTEAERASSIGFILQDPIIFAGTLKENIIYGNLELEGKSSKEISEILEHEGLIHLFDTYEQGIDTMLPKNIDSMSLGQKQILAFVRAVLRKPELLILDEATANIDTVTEQILETILKKLPQTTTKVVIAHRLNTIQNADVIFFVNNSTLTRAGSIDEAVQMLLKGAKNS